MFHVLAVGGQRRLVEGNERGFKLGTHIGEALAMTRQADDSRAILQLGRRNAW